MSTNVHVISQTGFGTGTNELYDRIRPSYPAESLSHIRQISKSTAPLNILAVRIGAGTGIFTRALLAHPEWATSIGTLRAVEPSDGMRDFWTKTVKDDRATIVNGTFDNTGVEDGWADLIVIAQAFHWCLDHGKAFAEFSRILNKDGAVVLIWNIEDRKAAGWVAQLCDRREVHEKATPQLRLDGLRQAFSTPEYTSLFHPLEEKEWAYNALATEQIVTDRVLSWSYISVLPPDEKAKLTEDVKVIIERGDGKAWIDKEEGTYQYPYRALVVVSRKK
ncbi:S-adenosyl-L-methionine-dependent methyltransferase [Suillus paluster]|uniref:S-adenosyl-L-methionine-dependent methyltransferase n=1 Tax=Suillus paluster TaxID=48578 RepID=UPI001B871182|nr:S-adenosyl-L-methionine-dependent methyltransferase [Suillus paluster]KAG1745883.1 S-adenosyl-L-methionine-dependent methyltransferase [Suillus paluster]